MKLAARDQQGGLDVAARQLAFIDPTPYITWGSR
jgi:hypothetical protein